MRKLEFSIPFGYHYFFNTQAIIRGKERKNWDQEQSGRDLYEALTEYFELLPMETVNEFKRLIHKEFG